MLHFGFNGWNELQDREAAIGPFGLWIVELSAAELAPHDELNFTRDYGGEWEGVDHRVQLGHVDLEHALTHVGE
jgi:glucoamylase